MPGNRDCTVYIGNLDERVSDRVLYEILVQAGRVVDLHIPRDKDTNRHKGFAFAEYESVEVAEYAVRLFSGLVTLHNRTLKFGISGQDKSSNKVSTPNMNPFPKPRSHIPSPNRMEISPPSSRNPTHHPNYAQQEPSPLGMVQTNGYGSNFSGNTYDYSRRVFGATMSSISQSSSTHRSHESRNPITYPSY